LDGLKNYGRNQVANEVPSQDVLPTHPETLNLDII
jgi:hypothetical protein